MDFQNALVFTEDFRFVRGAFSVENGRFANVLGQARPGAVDLEGAMVIPGLVDIHTHGCAGADFSDGDETGLRSMAAWYAQHGVTSFLPASMTLPYETLERAFAAGRAVADRPDPRSARLLGIRMEGPFVSEQRRGAQNPDYLKNPDFAAFQALNDGCGGLIRMVDLAAELPGAAEFARRASQICAVSIAHTDCTYDQAAALLDAGAGHLTHLFNAMPPIHHRSPGPIGACSEREAVLAELICDGVHVHPSAVRMAFKLFPGRVCLISDSMRACGVGDGASNLGGQEVAVRGRRAALADGSLAGSVTSLYDCMTTAVSFGIAVEEAVRAATWNPARAVGCLEAAGSIRDGKPADFVVCGPALERRAVYVGGEPV